METIIGILEGCDTDIESLCRRLYSSQMTAEIMPSLREGRSVVFTRLTRAKPYRIFAWGKEVVRGAVGVALWDRHGSWSPGIIVQPGKPSQDIDRLPGDMPSFTLRREMVGDKFPRMLVNVAEESAARSFAETLRKHPSARTVIQNLEEEVDQRVLYARRLESRWRPSSAF